MIVRGAVTRTEVEFVEVVVIHKKVWRSRRHDKQTDLEHKRIRSGVHLAVPPAIATMPPYTHPPIASGARHLVHVLSPARWWRPPASLASPVSGSPVQDSLLSNSRAGVRQERPRGRGGGSPYPSGTSEVQQLGAASLGPSRGVRGLWAFEITPTRGGGILWAPSGHCPKRMDRGEITCHGGASVASFSWSSTSALVKVPC